MKDSPERLIEQIKNMKKQIKAFKQTIREQEKTIIDFKKSNEFSNNFYKEERVKVIKLNAQCAALEKMLSKAIEKGLNIDSLSTFSVGIR